VSVLARRVASVPVRTAGQTWQAVVDLLSQPGSAARTTLESVAGLASMLIAEEYTARSPVVIVPASGSRVRIYTLHGDDALGDDVNESALAVWPAVAAGWSLALPVSAEDLELAERTLAKVPGVTAYEMTSDVSMALDSGASSLGGGAADGSFTIDLDEMRR